MITRVVMVQFEPGKEAETFREYEAAKAKLARLPCVKRMVSGSNLLLGAEANTRGDMPRVTYPHALSIWEFEDEAGLEAFLSAPEHLAMVQQGFVRHIAHRWVANVKT